jgi:hypothetical protein
LTLGTPTFILTPSLARGIFGYEEASHCPMAQGVTHLRVSRDYAAGFAGDAYATSGPFFHDVAHRVHQLINGSQGHFPPEGLL